MDIPNFLIIYILPPLVGAIIGYVTNALAIKMLFRPLKAYYIWGIKIPFTPGIIPRQRESLASNIGTMVSSQLISADTVQSRLNSPGTREALEQNIAHSLEAYASKTFRELFSKPSQGEDFWKGVLGRPEFEEILRRLGDLILDSLYSLSPSDLLGWKDGGEDLPWNRPEAKREFLTFIENRLNKWSEEGGSLKEVLGPESFKGLAGLMDGVYPSAMKGLFHWLETPEVKNHLETSGKVLLERILEKLSGVQRFFLSAGQYDKTLSENMGSIIKDIIHQLKGFMETPLRRAEIIYAMVGGLEKYLDFHPQKENTVSWEVKKTQVLDLVGKSWDLLIPTVGPWGEDTLNKPLEVWIENLTGLKKEEFRDLLVHKLLNLVQTTVEVPQAWLELRPKDLLPLNSTDYEKAASFISQQLYHWTETALPKLLETFNVQKVVEDRVNSLDILQVESLLLLVIKKHLTYINWIGALLGALIGGIQVLLTFLKA